jgi:hypothetical protein
MLKALRSAKPNRLLLIATEKPTETELPLLHFASDAQLPGEHRL